MKLIVHKIFVWPLSILLIVGFSQIGSGDVLCIGEDGHVEIETECLPSCNEAADICELSEQSQQHDEHDDCNNCSDLSLDEPMWSKRFLRYFLVHTFKIEVMSSFSSVQSAFSLKTQQSLLYKNSLVFKSNPNYSIISVTVLRC